MLSGTVNLDPIPLASCDGWITVYAAELSDDRNDGWRNAPCPQPDGNPVGSDGTGAGWPDYSEYDEDDPRGGYPKPEPQSAPVMMAHSLPIIVSDPTGDLFWQSWEPEYAEDADLGSRLSTDVTSLSLSNQDSAGWIRVTITLAAAFDLNDVATAATSTPRSASAGFGIQFTPIDGSYHEFGMNQLAICTLCIDPDFTRNRRPFYDDGDGRVPTEQARSYVRVASNLTGSTFSFDIRPPANLRDRRFSIRVLSFNVNINDNDGNSATYNTSSADYVELPPDFTLPGIP